MDQHSTSAVATSAIALDYPFVVGLTHSFTIRSPMLRRFVPKIVPVITPELAKLRVAYVPFDRAIRRT
jgi:hypothetical protein